MTAMLLKTETPYNPLDLAEMLRRVPGVQARQEYGGGGRLDISIRGLDAGRSRRILMLEDGIPISINPYSEPDMYYAPPVERMSLASKASLKEKQTP